MLIINENNINLISEILLAEILDNNINHEKFKIEISKKIISEIYENKKKYLKNNGIIIVKINNKYKYLILNKKNNYIISKSPITIISSSSS